MQYIHHIRHHSCGPQPPREHRSNSFHSWEDFSVRSILGLVALLCVGCASQTPAEKPAPAAPGAAAADAKPAASAQLANSETPAVTAAAGSVSSSGVKKAMAVPGGYHIVERNGEKFYCTDAPQLGTRVKSRVQCVSQEQFERSQTEAQDKMRERQGQITSHE
jgi:hypothetical protein